LCERVSRPRCREEIEAFEERPHWVVEFDGKRGDGAVKEIEKEEEKENLPSLGSYGKAASRK
jgi:hypothetical protein